MMPVKARPGKFIPAQVVRKLRESALDDLAAEGQKLGMYSPRTERIADGDFQCQ